MFELTDIVHNLSVEVTKNLPVDSKNKNLFSTFELICGT